MFTLLYTFQYRPHIMNEKKDHKILFFIANLIYELIHNDFYSTYKTLKTLVY